MAKASLSFAKIVATPTDSAWAQAYNEGSVFVVLSLTQTSDIEPESLNTIGKEVLSIFRAEFFGLEEKSLPALKEAVNKSFEHVPSSILISFLMAFNKDDILYLLLVGGGKAVMKRADQTGVLLEQAIKEPSRAIHSASGVLKSQDTVLLQTQEFAEKVSSKTLQEALSLELPNDMAEALSPGIHNSEQGGAAAIILSFHGITSSPIDFEEDTEEEKEATAETEELPKPLPLKKAEPEEESVPDMKEEEAEEKNVVKKDTKQDAAEFESPLQTPNEKDEVIQEEVEEKKFPLPISLPSLPRRSMMLIGIVVILAVILIGSIIATKSHQEQSKNHTLFEQIYNDAQKDYDEGVGLLSLNKSLARDDFLSAQKTLEKGDGKFKEGSEEQKKIAELQNKIKEQLDSSGGGHTVEAKEVSLDTSPLLQIEAKTKDAVSFTEDENFVYVLNSKNVSSVDKGNEKEDTLVTNDSDWEKPVALGYYLGNIYILDRENGVLKFVQAGNDYTKSSYLKGEAPDLNKAVAMTIDGSIYILFSDGNILKYTKGTPDSFKVTDLLTPLSSPTKIVTTADFQNLYVLDPKSSRIVVLNKTGAFQSEVSASVLKDAKDLTVDTKEETATVLSGGKTYSLPLK